MSALACFGVMCPQHKRCARYHAVEGAGAGQSFIATCDVRGTGERPLFASVHSPHRGMAPRRPRVQPWLAERLNDADD